MWEEGEGRKEGKGRGREGGEIDMKRIKKLNQV